MQPLQEGLQHRVDNQPRTYGAVQQQSGEAIPAGTFHNNRKGGDPGQDSHPDYQQFFHASSPVGVTPLFSHLFSYVTEWLLG